MKYWIWLSELAGTGPKLQRSLLECFGSPEDVYNAGYEELVNVPGIGKVKAEQILGDRSLERALKIEKDCDELGIEMLCFDNPEYPGRLRENPDMPVLLYYRGDLGGLSDERASSGIVGPRRCSRYGRGLAIEIASRLSAEGRTVVSGMALGVDAYAHTACLREGGFTVAVLGCGLDICFPPQHKGLKREIEKRGLVLSQYAPGMPAEEFTFPQRNRIIAALSDELYVVTPGRKSGSMITAGFAEKYGKRVEILREGGD